MSKRDRERIKKNTGKAYMSRGGFAMPERSIRSPCNLHCRLGCRMKLTEERRKKLFEYYYSLGNPTKQWQFLANQIVQTGIKRRKHKKDNQISERNKRNTSIEYYLPNDNNERIRVCQPMFLATFAISQRIISTVVRKTNSDGKLMEADLRGRTQKIAT